MQGHRICAPAVPRDAILVGERERLRRFLVLVTGTLVYGKGDKMEAKAEGLLAEGEERLFAPVAAADPAQAQPAAVPGAHRRSSAGTAPIAMRATPGSLKARPGSRLPARMRAGLSGSQFVAACHCIPRARWECWRGPCCHAGCSWLCTSPYSQSAGMRTSSAWLATNVWDEVEHER